MLTYFDPQKDVTIQVDTSKNGLGAVTIQEGKALAYDFKLLNSIQQNYAQNRERTLCNAVCVQTFS